jgi:hypothetical protein
MRERSPLSAYRRLRISSQARAAQLSLYEELRPSLVGVSGPMWPSCRPRGSAHT